MIRRVVLVCTLLVGACAPGPGIRPEPDAGTTSTTSPPTSTTPTTVPDGGTVVIGLGDLGSPRTLNPFLDGPDLAVLDVLGHAIGARGWIADPVTGEPVPEVLAAIPSVADGSVTDNGDGTIEVRVGVRSGVRWSDGTPLTADDLAFTIEIATDPSLPIRSDLADRYRLVIPGTVRSEGSVLTLRMRATTAYDRLFDVILPRHAVGADTFTSAWTERAWVGAGPFVVGQFVPGQLIALERNDAYWKQGNDGARLPLLDRVIVRFSEPGDSPDPRILEGFTTGDLDVVTIARAQVRAADYRTLEGTTVVTMPGPVWEFLTFQFGPGNRNPVSQNRHLQFRRAVAHAIDRDALALASGTAPVTSVLGRYGVEPGSASWERYPFDPTRVRALLDELDGIIPQDPFAGDGLDVRLTVPADDSAAVATAGRVVNQLRAAGFDAQLQLEDPATFFGPTVDNGSWDIASWGITATPGVGAAAAFLTAFDPDGLPFVGANFFRWGTIDSTVSGPQIEAYRRLADELRVMVEPSEAAEVLRSMEDILTDQVVIIPLTVRDDIGVAWRSDVVSGPAPNPFAGVAWNIASWRRTG